MRANRTTYFLQSTCEHAFADGSEAVQMLEDEDGETIAF